MRDYPPLTHQTGVNSYNGKPGDSSTRAKHIGHTGSNSGNQDMQVTDQSNGTNERRQQSRDVDGSDRGLK